MLERPERRSSVSGDGGTRPEGIGRGTVVGDAYPGIANIPRQRVVRGQRLLPRLPIASSVATPLVPANSARGGRVPASPWNASPQRPRRLQRGRRNLPPFRRPRRSIADRPARPSPPGIRTKLARIRGLPGSTQDDGAGRQHPALASAAACSWEGLMSWTPAEGANRRRAGDPRGCSRGRFGSSAIASAEWPRARLLPSKSQGLAQSRRARHARDHPRGVRRPLATRGKGRCMGLASAATPWCGEACATFRRLRAGRSRSASAVGQPPRARPRSHRAGPGFWPRCRYPPAVLSRDGRRFH